MTERDLFIAALQRGGPAQRRAYLDEACARQPELRRQVEHLLRLFEGAGQFLERPAAESASTGALRGADQSAASSPEVIGTVLGPYKLVERIGEGGMGTVWMAQQAHPVRRLVAIKLIKPGMDSKAVLARFETERQALALMDHPNIARVLDGGEAPPAYTGGPPRPYFVMDLVKGVPITRYCDEHRLTPRQRLELFVSVCQAVQHAHQKGVIHRDLKPSNVLVAPYDGRPVVKVIDFGVAKAAGPPLTEQTLVTGFGAIVGTLEYMSPEQAELNNQDIDTRSDIYALGALLYELLTGSPPLTRRESEQAGMLEMLRVIREQEPSRPSTKLSTAEGLSALAAKRGTEPALLTRQVRGELDWIVMKALEKDRDRRYDTATAFASDVECYLADEPVQACPPSAWYRLTKFVRRHRRELAAAAVVALVVLLSAAISSTLIWQSNRDLQQALGRERRGAYLERIALAEREWAANNLSRMEELLGQCPADLRGWEWHYLKRLRYSTLPPLPHESAALCVAFSPPDGQLLATATQAGIVRIWQAKTGQELRRWPAHAENATALAFSPDGRYLATGGWDGTVNLWEVEKVLQGEAPAPLLRLEPTRRVWSVAFSPDGLRLASGSGRTAEEKGEARVWDLGSRQEVLALRHFADSVTCVQFSPDGRRLATTSKGVVQIWDAQTGQEQRALGNRDTRRMGVAFSPDGRRLAAVGGHLSLHPDETVQVWDAQSGQELLNLRGHVGGLRSVAFCPPDGRRLASAGLDQSVKLWDAETGQLVLTLRGHIDHAYSIAFSPDGRRLASASLDRTVRVWDATPMEQGTIPESLTLRGHTGAVTDVAFSPTDDRTLISAGTDGTVRLWDAVNGKQLVTLHGPPSPKRVRVACSPDGRLLAGVSAEPGQAVRVWEVATWKEICRFTGHSDGALCLAFSPDSRHIASSGFDFTVRVWDARTAQEVQAHKEHTWPIHGVAFSPDGRLLASASADSSVRVRDWRTGLELRALGPRHATRVSDVAFSRDGKLLASASWDRTVKVWETATWRLRHDLSHPSGVQSVAFNPDGRRLAWGSMDGTITVWDGPDREAHTLRGHTSWAQAVAFSRDGKWIASASLDGTVKVWQSPPEAKATEAARERE